MNNLDSYFKGKTEIVVAHRLSTVRHADKIVGYYPIILRFSIDYKINTKTLQLIK